MMEDAIDKEEVTAEAAAPETVTIFTDFLKLGLTAFGGPAIIAHIRELAVTRRGWLDQSSFKDGVILSQSIPGATAMQVAAYVGLRTKGIRGAAAAYLGLGLPAFFMMVLLSQFYMASRSAAPALAIFGGLQVVVVAIVAHSALSFGKDISGSFTCSLLAACSAILLQFGADPFLVIVASAAAGALLFRKLSPDAGAGRGVSGTSVPRMLLVAALLAAAGLLLLYCTNRKLLSLALLMLRINFFAFGGGLSALPLMHHEIVSRGWMDSKAFLDGIALGQVTPGPISITGTFIGYLLFGLTGAITATLATFSPSFLLLIVAEPYWSSLKASPVFARACKGIMSCFVGLLFYVTFRFARDISWDAARALLGAVAFLALLRKVDLLIVVFLGALFSILFL